jgi:alpha/beta superfamily hydrolase
MNTKAVYRAAQVFTELGLRTLRFNFRGVGCSTGTFDDGIGEQEDVTAALDWLELGGVRDLPVIVGGVSFGSLVGLSVGAEDPRVKGLVGLGLPVELYEYSFLGKTAKPALLIQGEQDRFGSPREVREAVDGLGSHIRVEGIPGAGHLFEGHFQELQGVIRRFFTNGPGAPALRAGGETGSGEAI